MAPRARFAALLVLGACQPTDGPRALPDLDRAAFRCDVQPVLAARCAFPACHGDARRPLRLYARGRERLAVAPEHRVSAPLDDAELEANYTAARAFAVDDRYAASLLLLKPLDTDAGGLFHVVTERYGERDVFASVEDPGYQRLRGWLGGKTSDPGCRATTEVGP